VNIREVARRIRANDIILSVGGDGTANIVANAAIESGQTGVSILPLPCGNGNDIATSLYGEVTRSPSGLATTLRYGEAESCRLLRCEYGQRVRYAMGYIGLGASAIVAERFYSPEYRRKKAVLGMGIRALSMAFSDVIDFCTIVQTFGRDNSFTYTMNDCEQKQAQSMLFSNIGRIVKYFRLNDRSIAETTGDNVLWPLVSSVLASNDHRTIVGQEFSEAKLTLRDTTAIQFDGEPDTVSSESDIKVSFDSDSLKILRLPSSNPFQGGTLESGRGLF
jgi:hypothetical protein